MLLRKSIYFASPLFSVAERIDNERICRALERWCDVFLPQRDGELIPSLIQRGVSKNDAYRIVFNRDVTAIKRCDALVINLDGRTIDEGAAFELGLAHGLGKTCVGYHTDSRVLLPYGINPMISVPLSETFVCLEDLVDWAKDFCSSGVSQRPKLVR